MALVGLTLVSRLFEWDAGSSGQKEEMHVHLFFLQVLELKAKI